MVPWVCLTLLQLPGQVLRDLTTTCIKTWFQESVKPCSNFRVKYCVIWQLHVSKHGSMSVFNLVTSYGSSTAWSDKHGFMSVLNLVTTSGSSYCMIWKLQDTQCVDLWVCLIPVKYLVIWQLHVSKHGSMSVFSGSSTWWSNSYSTTWFH